MKILFELSWLWKALGISLLVSLLCATCMLIIFKAKKVSLRRNRAALIAIIACAILSFAASAASICFLAQSPALIGI